MEEFTDKQLAEYRAQVIGKDMVERRLFMASQQEADIVWTVAIAQDEARDINIAGIAEWLGQPDTNVRRRIQRLVDANILTIEGKNVHLSKDLGLIINQVTRDIMRRNRAVFERFTNL